MTTQEENEKKVDAKDYPGTPPAGCLFFFILIGLIIQGVTTQNRIYWILAGVTIVAGIIIGNNKELSDKLNKLVGILFIIILIIAFIVIASYFS